MSDWKAYRIAASAAFIGCGILSTTQSALAQAEPYMGQMMLVPYNFCPDGWADASGQLLSIAQNTALFSLLGTQFGGNGQTTFALPDLQGRFVIGQGSGAGLSLYQMGQVGGAESRILTINEMPAHNHQVQATNAFADMPGPGGKFLAADSPNFKSYHQGPPTRMMNSAMITPTGGNQPSSIMNPYLAMRWCIALEGVFPSRP